MADNAGRGSASGKKKGTAASKAALKIRGRATRRLQQRSSRALNDFYSKNRSAHMYLAEVVKAEGTHMDVLTKSGRHEKVRISGSVAVPRKVAHQLAGSEHDKMYVIVDGGDVVGHVPASEVAEAKKKANWPEGKDGLDDLFNRGASGHRVSHLSSVHKANGTRGKKGNKLPVIHEDNENKTRRRSRR